MAAAPQLIKMPAWVDVAPTVADLRKLMERKVMSLHHLRRTNAELEAILAVDASDADLREALEENRPIEAQFTRQLTKLAKIVEQLELASKAGLAVAFVEDDEEEEEEDAAAAFSGATHPSAGAATSTAASASSAVSATATAATGAGASGGLPATGGTTGTGAPTSAVPATAAPAAVDARPQPSSSADAGDASNAADGMYL